MYSRDNYKNIRPEIKKNIGNALRYCRNHASKSQEDIADLVGVNKSNISRYESGRLDVPASIIPIVADYCHLSMKDFSKRLDISVLLQKAEIADTEKDKLTEELMDLSDADIDLIISTGIIVERLSGGDYEKNEGLSNQLMTFVIDTVKNSQINEKQMKRLLSYCSLVKDYREK